MSSVVRKIFDRARSAFSQPGFRRYFINTSWLFGEKVLRMVAGLFVGAYVARYLGPAQFGQLNYALSIVSLFAVVTVLGMDSLVVRNLVRFETKRAQIMGTAFTLRLCSAIIVYSILFVFISLTETDLRTRTLVMIIAAGNFFEMFAIIDFFFQSRVTAKYTVWSQMIALTISSIVRIILIQQEASLEWFALSYSLDFFVLAIGLIVFYSRKVSDYSTWRFDKEIAKQFLVDCTPLIVSSLAVTIYMKVGQIMIRWMLGDAASGNYSVAVRLCELWNFIPMAICSSVFPAILKAREVSEELYRKRLQQLYDLMVMLALAIAVPMTLFPDFIVTLLFGDAYVEASGVIVLYMWSSVFVFLGVANGKWVISENLQSFRMMSLIGAGVINVCLNYILIKLIGLHGAAVSSLVSYAFAGYFSFLFTRKTRTMFVSMTRSFNPIRWVRLITKSEFI